MKLGNFVVSLNYGFSFNRTIEELKHFTGMYDEWSNPTFNRTIEELKLSNGTDGQVLMRTFNRTIEELKLSGKS